jgi:phage tail sheath protein FI
MATVGTYPGVYVQEISSGVRTITGVSTSITAFVGRALRGPTDEAITINNFGDFEKQFGGLWADNALGFAVRDFFLNGGSQAIIVRLFHPKAGVSGQAAITIGALKFVASSPGKWGAGLTVSIDQDNISPEIAAAMGLSVGDLFNLAVTDPGSGRSEKFANLTVANSPRRVDKVLEANSDLLRYDGAPVATALDGLKAKSDDFKSKSKAYADAQKKISDKLAGDEKADVSAEKAAAATAKTAFDAAKAAFDATSRDGVSIAQSAWAAAKKALTDKQNSADGADASAEKQAVSDAKAAFDTAVSTAANAVSDGEWLTVLDFLPAGGEADKKGLFALEQADLFNLLCIPPYRSPADPIDVDVNLIASAAAYCETRRAMLLVDAPKDWISKDKAKNKFNDANNENVGTRSRNAAIFFPRLLQPNPLRNNQMETFAACGALAGVFARTDSQRGVWKAPAGLDASLVGVPSLSVPLTDAENGELNPLGINCLRAFQAAGRVSWGARTLRGADQLADEYKYIPVRRTALFIEESLFRGLKWVVFEPNDEPLWAQIRLNVGAFMHNLFRQGAFQGTSPKDAYFVKCDKETTTQNDIDLGIVNIVVGFAPLKPAEFVVIKLQQIAGQVEV